MIRHLVIALAAAAAVDAAAHHEHIRVDAAALRLGEQLLARLHHGSVSGASTKLSGRAAVLRIVDGDTLHVRLDRRDVVVRTYGDDTPETHWPGTPVECGGPQATAHLRALVPVGTTVTLRVEPGGDTTDRYGRLLRWVDTPNGNVEREQVAAGWAAIYRYNGRRSSRDAQLVAAATAARRARRGIYGQCAGNFHEATR